MRRDPLPGVRGQAGRRHGVRAEFRAGHDRNFLCWCAGCGLMCTVVVSPRLVSHEPEH